MKRLATMTAALALAIALSGCTQGPSAADLKAECFVNQARVQAVMKLFSADTGMDAPFESVLAKADAVCPSGGKYSWDPATSVVSCSVHGHP